MDFTLKAITSHFFFCASICFHYSERVCNGSISFVSITISTSREIFQSIHICPCPGCLLFLFIIKKFFFFWDSIVHIFFFFRMKEKKMHSIACYSIFFCILQCKEKKIQFKKDSFMCGNTVFLKKM